jgi:hypothetical protein
VSGIEAATQAIFNTDAFKKSLVAMERSVVQNIYHEQQLKYRGTSRIPHEAIHANRSISQLLDCSPGNTPKVSN